MAHSLSYHVDEFAFEFVHEGAAGQVQQEHEGPEVEGEGGVLPEGAAVKDRVPVAGDDVVHRIQLHDKV